MNLKKLFPGHPLAVVFCVVACAAAAAIVGCEVGVEPLSEAYVTIEPQQVTLHKNQTQDFVASGAVTYRWYLSHTNAGSTNQIWGTLDRYSGERVRYTCRRTPSSAPSLVQTLTVVGTIGTGDTNTEAVTLSTEAYIKHAK